MNEFGASYLNIVLFEASKTVRRHMDVTSPQRCTLIRLSVHLNSYNSITTFVVTVSWVRAMCDEMNSLADATSALVSFAAA